MSDWTESDVRQFAGAWVQSSHAQLAALAGLGYARTGRGALSVTVPGARPQHPDFREIRIGYRPLDDLQRRVRRAPLSATDRAGAEDMIRLTEGYDPLTTMVVTVGCGPQFLRTTIVMLLDAALLEDADGAIH